jgi:hypothetical protein
LAGTDEQNGPTTAHSPPREKLRRLESCVADVIAAHSPVGAGLVANSREHGSGVIVENDTQTSIDANPGVTIESNAHGTTGQFILGSVNGIYNKSPLEEKQLPLFDGEYVRGAPREEAAFSITVDSHSPNPGANGARVQEGHLKRDGTLETVGGMLDPQTWGVDEKQRAVNSMAKEVKACFESQNSPPPLRKPIQGFKP